MRRIDDPIVVEDSKPDGRYRSLSFRTFVASVLGLLCVCIRNLSFALFRLSLSKFGSFSKLFDLLHFTTNSLCIWIVSCCEFVSCKIVGSMMCCLRVPLRSLQQRLPARSLTRVAQIHSNWGTASGSIRAYGHGLNGHSQVVTVTERCAVDVFANCSQSRRPYLLSGGRRNFIPHSAG